MDLRRPSTEDAAPYRTVRPRRSRAIKACNQCREKKRRCDENQPCLYCAEANSPCEYSLNRTESKHETIEGTIRDLQSTVTQLNSFIRHLDDRLSLMYVEIGTMSERRALHGDSHFTGPHHLISSWPKIRLALEEAHIDISEDYVLEAEEGRNASAVDTYKRINGCSPHLRHGHNSDYFTESPPLAGWFGHAARGVPSADRSRALLTSYVRHMHVLHPFLDLTQVDRLFKRLVDTKMERATPLSDSSYLAPNHVAVEAHESSTDHPLDEAILLMILAIGSVCGEKAAMPPIVTMSNLYSAASQDCSDQMATCHRNWNDLTSNTHSPVPKFGTSLPTSTCGSASFDQSRLLFSMATKAIGPHAASNDLVSAQAFLLVGLYKSQMGLVCDSMYWIHMAGRVCQVLLRRHGLLGQRDYALHRNSQEQIREMQSRVKRPLHNAILLSTWSCIQLESDILAELPLVPSGVLQYENLIPWPTDILGAEVYNEILPERLYQSNDVLTFYLSQLWLRKRLNHMQNQLYGNACLSLPSETLREHLRSHQEILATWRSKLPAPLQWREDDLPASDILSARLRAKYFGACYLATRPFLDYALHCIPEGSEGRDWKTVAAANRSFVDIRVLGAIEGIARTDPSEMWQAAKDCVQAAARSTLAFDGIPHHLIVTNMHGTSHAQFGNMLVLSAAAHYYSTSHFLFKNVDVGSLLQRTIKFLGRQYPTFPTCNLDRDILVRLSELA